ncbi:3-phosphoshikimate 1-carboxyvinyltransferase [compost metagenome]
MSEFRYQGPIPASKSLYNRALIVKSYFPVMELFGESECDDVRHMKEAIEEIKERSHIDCGEGGTTFRFLALRVSRQRGVHTLEGSERLMQRPQKELIEILKHFGVQAQMKRKGMLIVSEGWKKPRGPIRVDSTESSQYASSLALNAWRLDFDLEFELVGTVSESYFAMTIQLLKQLGMRIHKTPKGYLIPAGERLSHLSWNVEPDISSAFTIATLGALCGEVILENFPLKSLQPDIVFLDIFKKMHVEYELADNRLTVKHSRFIKPLEWNLSQSPDLFPVLAMLCAHAHGTSKLFGAPHLVSKESNRIQKVADLFDLIGVQYEALTDGMIIHGKTSWTFDKGGSFNPDKDHRMVMAAVVLKMLGHPIVVEDPHVINKSFPEFWRIVGIKP